MLKTFLVGLALALFALPTVSAEDPPSEEPDGTNDACVATGWNTTPYVILDTPECQEQAEASVQVVRDMFGI